MKKRDVIQVAEALVDTCRDLPDGRLAEAIDAALHLLERRGLSRAIRTFPRAVADVLRKKEGIIVASLTTPAGAGEHHASIESALRAALGKKISLEEKKDSSILGGAFLSHGDERFDGSIRCALQRLRLHLSTAAS